MGQIFPDGQTVQTDCPAEEMYDPDESNQNWQRKKIIKKNYQPKTKLMNVRIQKYTRQA